MTGFLLRYAGAPYLFLWRWIEVAVIRRLAQMNDLHLENAVDLDIGCGDGIVGGAVAKRIRLGLDMDPAALSWSRRLGVYKSLACASATALPLRAGSQRVILCNCVLEHITDDGAALAEMARVLAPGGYLILTLAGRDLPGLVLGEHTNSNERAELDRSLNHRHYYTFEAIAGRLQEVNLIPVDSQTYIGPREAQWWYRLRLWQRNQPTPIGLARRRLGQMLRAPVTLGLIPFVLWPARSQRGAALALLARKPAPGPSPVEG